MEIPTLSEIASRVVVVGGSDRLKEALTHRAVKRQEWTPEARAKYDEFLSKLGKANGVLRAHLVSRLVEIVEGMVRTGKSEYYWKFCGESVDSLDLQDLNIKTIVYGRFDRNKDRHDGLSRMEAGLPLNFWADLDNSLSGKGFHVYDVSDNAKSPLKFVKIVIGAPVTVDHQTGRRDHPTDRRRDERPRRDDPTDRRRDHPTDRRRDEHRPDHPTDRRRDERPRRDHPTDRRRDEQPRRDHPTDRRRNDPTDRRRDDRPRRDDERQQLPGRNGGRGRGYVPHQTGEIVTAPIVDAPTQIMPTLTVPTVAALTVPTVAALTVPTVAALTVPTVAAQVM